MGGQGADGISLYLPLHVAVYFKLLFKKLSLLYREKKKNKKNLNYKPYNAASLASRSLVTDLNLPPPPPNRAN